MDLGIRGRKAIVNGGSAGMASRSAEAAKEIKKLISDNMGKVDTGTQQVNAAGVTIQAIVDQVHQVSTLIHDMHNATAAQYQGISEVSGALARIDQVLAVLLVFAQTPWLTVPDTSVAVLQWAAMPTMSLVSFTCTLAIFVTDDHPRPGKRSRRRPQAATTRGWACRKRAVAMPAVKMRSAGISSPMVCRR